MLENLTRVYLGEMGRRLYSIEVDTMCHAFEQGVGVRENNAISTEDNNCLITPSRGAKF